MLQGSPPAREPVTRIGVTVTFLRMAAPPSAPARALPQDTALLRVPRCSVPFYRYLYATVGGGHAWWLRRIMPDGQLAGLLADPLVSIHVLYRGAEPAGFFELDGRVRPDMNLSYFGLMPWAVGTGLGTAFLRAAVDLCWAQEPRVVTVNTCSADHAAALPTYLAAGFRPMRSVREVWDIPDRLGMTPPRHLRV